MSGSLIWVHGSVLQKAIQQRLGFLGRGRLQENTRFRFLEFSGEFHRNFGKFLACMSLCPAQAILEASLELPEETSELELESAEVSVLDESLD